MDQCTGEKQHTGNCQLIYVHLSYFIESSSCWEIYTGIYIIITVQIVFFVFNLLLELDQCTGEKQHTGNCQLIYVHLSYFIESSSCWEIYTGIYIIITVQIVFFVFNLLLELDQCTGEKQHTGNCQLIYVHLSYFNRLPLKWSLNKRFHPLQTEYYEFVIASPKFHLASFVQHFGDAPFGLQSIVQRHYIYARIVRFVFYLLENAVRYKHRLYMVLSPDIVVWILRGQKDFVFSCHFITLLVI